jgi:DNA-binding transcriptional ArsR family regulator
MSQMTDISPTEADWLHALGHPYRVEIMRRFLAAGTTTPVEIAGHLALPLGTVSYHVKFLARRGIVRLAGRTQRRGASVHHYQLTDRERVAALLWGIRAALLVTDFERQNGRADATVQVDSAALVELRALTAAYLARIGELGLQARERSGAEATRHDEPIRVAVMLATEKANERIVPGRQ